MYEWDDGKRASNKQKHGVDFADIEHMDWDTALISRDDRQDYGEERIIVLGLIKGRVHVAAVTYRGENVRVITLRKANPRERKLYDEFAR